MRLDDCSEFRGYKLKSCSRCGHQFDALKLTRLNCDQLNAIKDKEWQFGFRWKLSDWAVGEVVKVDVCPSCYASVVNLINTNEMVENLERNTLLAKQLNGEYQGEVYAEPYRVDMEHHDTPVYVNGEYQGEAKQEPFKIREEDLRPYAPFLNDLWGLNKHKDGMVDAAMYAYEKLQHERKILKFKLEERKMKNVNETKTHAFAIERNYDETDRKLFKLEDAETGDFIRLATDEDRLIYMVVNIAPVKNRVKVNEKSGSNCVWCVCIQTQDLVELNGDEMVYVYDPRYIAFRIGRFIDA